MKKNVVLLICSFLLVTNIYSQNIITLKELISISEMNIGEVNDLLSNKNYTFEFERKNEVGDLYEYSWKHFENFTLTISIYRSKDIRFPVNGSAYFFEGIEIYNSLKKECIALGFKQTDSFTENGSFIIKYKNSKYSIKLSSKSKPNLGAWYAISVDKV